jgi:hypothetical protein
MSINRSRQSALHGQGRYSSYLVGLLSLTVIRRIDTWNGFIQRMRAILGLIEILAMDRD